MWWPPALNTIPHTVNPESPVPHDGAPPTPAPTASAASSESASKVSGSLARADAEPGSPARPLILWGVVGVFAMVTVVAAATAWTSIQRVRLLEQQLVARQQQSQTEATEAVVLARQSQDTAREVAAKMALLEARVSEAAVQRTQLDELIQSLTRSRDENLLADLEAALRVAQQQSALTGSPEPVVSTLRQAEERLARYNQPRLERVRRAVLRDLERAQAVVQIDVASLVIRIDEVVRQVDDLPLGGVPSTSPGATSAVAAAARSAAMVQESASAPSAAPSAPQATPTRVWLQQSVQWLAHAVDRAWDEVRSLVRLTRVDNPEALMASPDQVFFLRENLKLRLLNARLSLLSRQFDVAQSDLRDAQRVLDRYFDGEHRRVVTAKGLLQQVGQQARLVVPPRPEETLAALASTNAGR